MGNVTADGELWVSGDTMARSTCSTRAERPTHRIRGGEGAARALCGRSRADTRWGIPGTCDRADGEFRLLARFAPLSFPLPQLLAVFLRSAMSAVLSLVLALSPSRSRLRATQSGASRSRPIPMSGSRSARRSGDGMGRDREREDVGGAREDPRFASLFRDARRSRRRATVFRTCVSSPVSSTTSGRTVGTCAASGAGRRWRGYRTASPQWTTVLDLDSLARAEKANWVWEGADCALPAERRCLLSLSDGGEDAVTLREFDLATRSFPEGWIRPSARQAERRVGRRRHAARVAREWNRASSRRQAIHTS
jgi:hypothetical protein